MKGGQMKDKEGRKRGERRKKLKVKKKRPVDEEPEPEPENVEEWRWVVTSHHVRDVIICITLVRINLKFFFWCEACMLKFYLILLRT